MKNKDSLSENQQTEILESLKYRFDKNIHRHEGIEWEEVKARLESRADKIRSLGEMERTGGEPDVIGYDKEKDQYIFCDCSEESPKGRRSLCYDRKALDSRKEAKPVNSVVEMASSMGIELLSEEQYKELQKLGDFDMKTSSWLLTPQGIRTLGGAIFGDKRYNHVFIYHNGAESYYGARGFRGALKV